MSSSAFTCSCSCCRSSFSRHSRSLSERFPMAFRYRQNRKIMARIYTTVTMPRTIASLCSPIDVRSFLNVQKTPSKYSSWTGFSLFTFGWSSWIRTSGMTESKSVALPLGYIPSSCPSLKQLNHYSTPFREMQYLFMFVYKAFTAY